MLLVTNIEANVLIVAKYEEPSPVVNDSVSLAEVYPNEVTPATELVDTAVIRPVESIVITGIVELLPYVLGTAPEAGNLDALNVPVLILDAFEANTIELI